MTYTLQNEDIIWDAMSPQDVIIADLQKGQYTTLSGIGAQFLWNQMINQNALTDIITACRHQFKKFNSADEKAIDEMITSLLEAGILKHAAQTALANDEEQKQSEPFEFFQVTLTQYDDMQTLLKLDPIDNLLED